MVIDYASVNQNALKARHIFEYQHALVNVWIFERITFVVIAPLCQTDFIGALWNAGFVHYLLSYWSVLVLKGIGVKEIINEKDA